MGCTDLPDEIPRPGEIVYHPQYGFGRARNSRIPDSRFAGLHHSKTWVECADGQIRDFYSDRLYRLQGIELLLGLIESAKEVR